MKSLKTVMMAVLTISSVLVFAQDSTMQAAKVHKQQLEKIKYSCPMHPDMVMDKSGKCSKCGMNLTEIKKRQMIMFSCLLHPDITSDKPGKCSKCGVDLTKSKEEQLKMYYCPMHPDVTSDKPGK